MRYRLASILPILLAAAACTSSQEGSYILSDGRVLEEPRDAVMSARAALDLELGGRQDVSLSGQRECFFSRGEDGRFDQVLFCGPISFLGASGPWATFTIESPGSSSRLVEAGVASPPGRALVTVEGARPPSDLYLQPPPIRETEVVTIASLPSGTVMTSRSGWTLSYPTSVGSPPSEALRVVSTNVSRSLGSSYDMVSAPPGYQLMLLEMDFREGVGSSDVVFEVGGRALQPLALSRYMVVPFPEGSEPSLSVVRPRPQSLSLVDGRVTGEAPRIWNYTPTLSVSGQTSMSRSFATEPISLLSRIGVEPVTLSSQYTLAISGPTYMSTSGTPAPPGRVWLDVQATSVSFSEPPRFFVPSLRLEVEAVDLYSGQVVASGSSRSSIRGLSVDLHVPEETDALLLRFTPYMDWTATTFRDDAVSFVEGSPHSLEVALSW